MWSCISSPSHSIYCQKFPGPSVPNAWPQAPPPPDLHPLASSVTRSLLQAAELDSRALSDSARDMHGCPSAAADLAGLGPAPLSAAAAQTQAVPAPAAPAGPKASAAAATAKPKASLDTQLAMQHPSRRSATMARKGGFQPSSARAAALQAVQGAHRWAWLCRCNARAALLPAGRALYRPWPAHVDLWDRGG